MEITWQYKELITNIVSSLLENDTSLAIAEFVEQVGESELIEHLDRDSLTEAVGEKYKPEEVFTQEELEVWANDNDFVNAAEMDTYDPPGYEERERY